MRAQQLSPHARAARVVAGKAAVMAGKAMLMMVVSNRTMNTPSEGTPSPRQACGVIAWAGVVAGGRVAVTSGSRVGLGGDRGGRVGSQPTDELPAGGDGQDQLGDLLGLVQLDVAAGGGEQEQLRGRKEL